MDQRPKLNNNITLEDFKDFYWLKKELIAFCGEIGIHKNGGKLELAERIAFYLKTGKIPSIVKSKKAKPTSNFDWNKSNLSLNTIITDNYKSTENLRTFFSKQLGKPFKFTVQLMNWMKANTGKTLEDALTQWHQFELEKKNSKTKKEIAPQFEYNTYIRDFLKDNPNLSRDSAIKHWKIKRSKRGDNVYRKSDLE